MVNFLRIITTRIVLVCISLCVLVACGSESVPLTGVVTDAYTGKPVPSVVIRVGSSRVMTDESGTYAVQRWHRSNTLSAVSDNYDAVSLNLSKRKWANVVTAADANIDISMRPNTISGMVRDAWTKQPLPGVVIRISDTLSVTTEADGQYMLRSVPESFTLSAELSEYVPFEKELNKTTTLDISLANGTLSGVVTDQYSGAPLADVVVTAGDVTGKTDEKGAYSLRNVLKRDVVTFAFDGYATLTKDASTITSMDITMRPDTLKGTIVDASTGEPIRHATVVATEDITKVGVSSVRVDDSKGAFVLNGLPESGFVFVLAPGYRKLVVPIKQGEIPTEFKMEPFTPKAVYITAAVASNPTLIQKFFDNIDKTELNAIVIDLKSDLRDDLGLVYYDSQVPLVKELGLSNPYYDINAILAEAKKRNIYTIARVHMFSHDNVLAEAKPEWAAQDRVNGGIFYDYPTSTIKYAWLDPFNENVWDYNIALSTEASLARI